MGAKSYEIGGEIFETQSALRARVRAVLDGGYPLGTTVSPEDSRFLAGLLARHPRASEKIGVGLRRIFIGKNPPWKPGLWLERLDGSTTEWSYKECLNPSSPFDLFREACRYAVRQQKLTFRDEFFARTTPPTCPLSGNVLTRDNCNVDHIAPDTFDELVVRFIAAEAIDSASIGLVGRSDGEVEVRFADAEFSRRWEAFHAAHARLRVIEARTHRRLPRGSRKPRAPTG